MAKKPQYEPLEMLRRVRLGQLKRVLRNRYRDNRFQLTDDDAGRDDIELLLRLSSDKNIPNTIEIWAPWFNGAEADLLIGYVTGMAPSVRLPSPETLGQRLRLTNDERVLHSAWQIRPYDMTKEELVEWRKARDRQRKRNKRKQTGAVPRQEYEAKSLSKQKPWLAEGISRAQWYRRRHRDETSASEINFVATGHTCLTPTKLHRPRATAKAKLTLAQSTIPKVVRNG